MSRGRGVACGRPPGATLSESAYRKSQSAGLPGAVIAALRRARSERQRIGGRLALRRGPVSPHTRRVAFVHETGALAVPRDLAFRRAARGEPEEAVMDVGQARASCGPFCNSTHEARVREMDDADLSDQ